ncbi:MAG: ABC transporter permease [Bacteroides sp.]|nr:ABC transporter permease [Bacteroides sp.]
MNNTLISLVKKEFLHIIRDRRTALITILMPLVLLLLFGYAISTEVNNINVMAVIDFHSDKSREILKKMEVNSYFTFIGLATVEELDDAMKRGDADAGLVMRQSDAQTEYQIIVDASNPNMAKTATAYLTGLIEPAGNSLVTTRTLYNPRLKSSYNFVPGIMGMIFILVCAIMTSVSIVSEKESGTMNLLLVSPIRPAMIIIGKLVPYFVLSCIILAAMLGLSYGLLDIPLNASVFNVILLSMLYIVLALSIGLLVSSIVSTQLAALIVSAMIFMIPIIFFSGMLFPIDNMPQVLQWLSSIIPARWYISALKKLMIQQLPVSYIVHEVTILGFMTLLILVIAIKKFKTR